MITLGSLHVGSSAVIKRVSGDRRHALRLMELGLLPGTPVELLRRAPLGDPLHIRLRGYALSLRRSDAEGIQLEESSITDTTTRVAGDKSHARATA